MGHDRRTPWRSLPVLGVGIAVLVARRDLLVRGIRWVDRHGGLASHHGEQAYAGATRLFGGLHRRVAADAVSTGANVILDIGAGPGDVLEELRRLAPDTSLIGVEPSERMRAIAVSRGIHEVAGRAERLPVPDQSVDLVLSTLSSHHWDDPAAAFAEMGRVLGEGGEARIYDLRFAGFGPDEARGIAASVGLNRDSVNHRVVDERVFGLRPYSLITIAR